MLLSRNANIDSAPKRTVAEETADGEMEIKINGPALSNDDSLIKSALDKHFGQNKWQFTTQGSLVPFMRMSIPVKRLKQTPSNLPFQN